MFFSKPKSDFFFQNSKMFTLFFQNIMWFSKNPQGTIFRPFFDPCLKSQVVWWNWLDLIIVLSGITELLLPLLVSGHSPLHLSGLRGLRLLRLARVARGLTLGEFFWAFLGALKGTTLEKALKVIEIYKSKSICFLWFFFFGLGWKFFFVQPKRLLFGGLLVDLLLLKLN